MRGYLYKDWLLCRKMILAAGIATLVMFIFGNIALLPERFWEDAFRFIDIADAELLKHRMDYIMNDTNAMEMWQADIANLTSLFLAVAIVPTMFALGIADKLCKVDEQKVWASFAIAAPGAAKQYVTAKYCFCLLIAVVPLAFFYLLQSIITALTLLPVDCTPFFMLIFYLVLLSFGLTFPFSARFGYRQGNNIRVILMVVLVFIGFVYFLFGDIAILQDFDALGEKLYNMMVGDEADTTLSVVLTVLPCVSIAVFGLSYPYSCKAYAKGVAHYDC